ncbi:MAG: metallophosphoesterase [Legionellales bacterium]|jgi:protein phosphatase
MSLYLSSKDPGPFDIIGDVHGCFDELHALLILLGYKIEKNGFYCVTHPMGRKVIFVGDLVDRGPKIPEVLRLVMDMIASHVAYCVRGNHDDKLRRALKGNKVKISHGLEESLAQLATQPPVFKHEVLQFLENLVYYYIFDQGKLVVAHAGIKEKDIGSDTLYIKSFCLYGETSNEIDAQGFPVRHPWMNDYHGEALIVYGHTAILAPEWVNNTICIDSGCVFGGRLTALRYPEKILVSVSGYKGYKS